MINECKMIKIRFGAIGSSSPVNYLCITDNAYFLNIISLTINEFVCKLTDLFLSDVSYG